MSVAIPIPFRKRPIRPSPKSISSWRSRKKKSHRSDFRSDKKGLAARMTAIERKAPEPAGGGVGAVPQHIAIIMDGNGRWAAARGLPRVEGHRRGVDAVRRAVKAAGELGVRYLTVYSFSSENWSRPKSEILDLMNLMRR